MKPLPTPDPTDQVPNPFSSPPPRASDPVRDALTAFYAHGRRNGLDHQAARAARRLNPTVLAIVGLLIAAAAIVKVAW